MNRENGPGLNLEHGFIKTIERSQVKHRQLVKDDFMKKQEVAKLARKVGQTTRSARPTQQIYRPPYKQLSPGRRDEFDSPPPNDVPKGVHFQLDGKGPNELKSALKRSKSFGAHEEVGAAGFEKDGFPSEYIGLVKRALTEPNVLSSRQLMEVVTVMCTRAVEGIASAQQTAQMCFSIIEKETNETFLESLLNSCREWYNERDKLLRGSNVVSRRWTAYVSFLMELYLRLKSHQRKSTSPIPTSSSVIYNQRLTLVMLIYECCYLIAKASSVGNGVEIECLRSTLTTSGAHLEKDAPDKMSKLMNYLRDAFLDPATPASARKTLLELIELHASQWEFNLIQSSYYFPYTTLVSNRKN